MNLYDQIAKAILKAVLRSITAELETSMEIRGHALKADAWVKPDPAYEPDLERLGLLGRLVTLGPCLVEPFSGVPDKHEIRSCILKQYSLEQAQRRDVETRNEPFPRLWIISTGSPDTTIKEMELRQMQDWPEACLTADPFACFHLIVARKLPKTPDTLLVRLLSSGDTFRDAMDDLAKVPETAPQMAKLAARVMHVLVEFRGELNQDQLEEDDMEAVRDMDAAFDEWYRQLKDEWTLDTIRKLCQDLDIELTEERLAQLAAWDADELRQALRKICISREWPNMEALRDMDAP